MKIYAFDCDHTLIISSGPVTLESIIELRKEGHIVGICGNWAAVAQCVMGWHNLFSFISPMEIPKALFLNQISTFIRAEEYVMVDNIIGVSGASDDKGAAEQAGWKFIQENSFAAGER